MVTEYGVNAIGDDRPGIVAALSARLLEHGANLDDSRMAILRGRFAISLVITLSDPEAIVPLRADLERAAADLGLDAISVSPLGSQQQEVSSEPTHVVTVYGADHAGIVHAITKTLAEQEANILDLVTRLVPAEGEEESIYAMFIELSLDSEHAEEELWAALERTAEEQGVEAALSPYEVDEL